MSAQSLLAKLYKGKRVKAKRAVVGLRTRRESSDHKIAEMICECGECCGY